MSIIDKFFNGGSARKNVPFGYDKRIVMPKSAQDTIPFYEVYDNGSVSYTHLTLPTKLEV